MTIDDEITPELERIQAELKKLKGMKIHVGVQGMEGYNETGKRKPKTSATILTIANVHEFGATIKAKNVKNLAIPIAKKAKGKSPRDFDGLFFIESDSLLYGCISKKQSEEPKKSGMPQPLKPKKEKPKNRKIKTGKEDDIEFLFLLLPSVNIPERSFIRAGYDNNRQAIEDVASSAVQNIVFSGWTAEMAANHIGMKITGMIQTYMNQPFNFKSKGDVTKATSNWPDNPLIESGRLRNSISYVIEE